MSTKKLALASEVDFKRDFHFGAALPVNEEERLKALQACGILDTGKEQAFDDLTQLAAMLCETPIATVTFVDRFRQWFKSSIGVDKKEDPRELSFCAHAILKPGEMLQVPNALEDARFVNNPLVTGGPGIRFYAGVPLVTREGAAIGTICVIDKKPKRLSEAQETALRCLARQVVAQLELREAVAELGVQSLTDPLTGVWNRRAFQIRLREEWARRARRQEPLALLMVDVDHFKKINDSYGHPAGDLILQRIAQLLAVNLRTNDYLVRYGGEEFSILLSACEVESVRIAAERARLTVSAAGWTGAMVTISIGIAAALPGDNSDPNLLVAEADCALYLAKTRGRNRVEVFEQWPASDELEDHLSSGTTLEIVA